MTTEIQEYSQTEAALSVLREKYADATYDVTTTDGMVAAKSGRSEVRGYRTSLEKMRKEIKAPALERCRLIDTEAKRITGELVLLEEPIDCQIKEIEAKKEAERQAKIDAEVERVETIQARIASICEHAEAANSLDVTAQNVFQSIFDIKAIKIDDSFGEFITQAETAKVTTIQKLDEIHLKLVQREEVSRVAAAQAKELAELKAANEKREAEAQAKLEAAEAEARKKREADAKAERDKLEKQRKEQAEAQAKIDAENKRLADEKARREAKAEAEKKRKAKTVADAKKAEFPGVQAIVDVLCEHFDVTEPVIKKWLKVLT